MNSQYFIQPKANIYTDNLQVQFLRLFEDVRDQMSDSPKPDWMPVDDFIIYVKEMHTTTHVKQYKPYTCTTIERKEVRSVRLTTTNKDVANQIWKVAKKYNSFDVVMDVYNQLKSA